MTDQTQNSLHPPVDLSLSFVSQMMNRLETANGGGARMMPLTVAAGVGAAFAVEVLEAAEARTADTDVVDRIGAHYRVPGGEFPDYCGTCQQPGDPDLDATWPCNDVRESLRSGEIIDLRREVQNLRAERDALNGRVTVLTAAGRMISEGAEKHRAERAILHAQATELRESLVALEEDRDRLVRGLIDPSPGQISAYLKAARAVAPEADDPFVMDPMAAPEAVRAGLAAVQWALLNPTTTDGGEEVSAKEARNGDRMTLTATICDPGTPDDLIVELWGRNYWLAETDIVFTRPPAPLPTEPAGTIIEATVNGRTVQLVLTDDPEPRYRWFTIAGHDPERGFRADRWVQPEEITDHKVISTPGGDQ